MHVGSTGGVCPKGNLSDDPTWSGGMQMIPFADDDDDDDDDDDELIRYGHDVDDALMRCGQYAPSLNRILRALTPNLAWANTIAPIPTSAAPVPS